MDEKRTKALSTIFVALAIPLLISMSIYAVDATIPVPIEGQILIKGYTSTVPNPAGESDNSIISLSLCGVFVGDIVGSYTSESHWVRHNVGTTDVWNNIHAIDIISPATVMGKTGSLTFMLNSNAAGGGTWVIVGGTGELASLSGQGTYSTGANPAVVNYEGQVHFDP